jgi:hypothetical protein
VRCGEIRATPWIFCPINELEQQSCSFVESQPTYSKNEVGKRLIEHTSWPAQSSQEMGAKEPKKVERSSAPLVVNHKEWFTNRGTLQKLYLLFCPVPADVSQEKRVIVLHRKDADRLAPYLDPRRQLIGRTLCRQGGLVPQKGVALVQTCRKNADLDLCD